MYVCLERTIMIKCDYFSQATRWKRNFHDAVGYFAHKMLILAYSSGGLKIDMYLIMNIEIHTAVAPC